MKIKLTIILAIAVSVVISGCGSNANDGNTVQGNKSASSNMNMEHSEMNHSGSGEIPQGLEEAANPKFEVGSEAMITEDHMPGMKGAAATIVGAYDTTVYAVTYTPTNGGDPVKNHKWVIHEELKEPADQPYEPGSEVILDADHMDGMKGAKATIDSAEHTTIYMVDYISTTNGEQVKNHQWVTESELTKL
ncbi:hypothetical protein D3C76_486680 [compost metagenome]